VRNYNKPLRRVTNMLQNDYENSEPYDWDNDPLWASAPEIAKVWSKNFDKGFCSMFGIEAPNFEEQ
jgi:hypothetical protein